MKGVFYAVGVGPGDPELLTLKAMKTIAQSDVIVAPDSGAGENIALMIAADYIKEKEIAEIKMPMIKEKAELEKYHDQAAFDISKRLEEGKNVAFLTLGDPTVYSTVMYVHKRIKEMGYQTEVIPGVPSFCAAAAALGQTLCMRDEMLHVVPATFQDVDRVLDLPGTKVLMKSGKTMAKLKEKLQGKTVMAVERATMKNQKIYKTSEELDETMSYFSVVIVPD